ncbi:hypothetical protein BB558_000929 [Smittium angustum]|uniref:Derlin n=1 Tax=Smittium angustum TaxID=133377 RepID=A0A2U1JCV5_SMIAN|nr:hypothetical protein BB558_004160 [Smittium angustum]PWA02921.1 hypothetical protein BB558_000929 [Smittium angustum]
MANPIEQWFFGIPVITRTYFVSTLLLTLAVKLEMVNMLSLYFDYKLVFSRSEYWRLITTFLYFGNLDVDWMFNMYFIVRYMRDVEEGYHRNRTGDYLWLLVVACTLLLVLSSIISLPFMGTALNYTITYIWSRQNPYIMMSFLGFFNFTAPYLPWVMMAVSALINNKAPINDLIGIFAGHILWFLEDEWPRRPESNGYRVLKAPIFIQRLFQRRDENVELLEPEGEDANYVMPTRDQVTLGARQTIINRPQTDVNNHINHESNASSSVSNPTSYSPSTEKEKTDVDSKNTEKTQQDSPPSYESHIHESSTTSSVDKHKTLYPNSSNSNTTNDGLRKRLQTDSALE